MWRTLHREDDGVALIVTISLTAVMAVLVTAALGYGLSSQRLARQDQDWNAALAAAEAGIDDYLLRLNRGGDYAQYNAGNLPIEPNPAFTGQAPVPGSVNGATFTYTVDNSRRPVDGSVVLTTTGSVGGAERTVRATLRPCSSLDYLYLSNYETTDPQAYTQWPPTARRPKPDRPRSTRLGACADTTAGSAGATGPRPGPGVTAAAPTSSGAGSAAAS